MQPSDAMPLPIPLPCGDDILLHDFLLALPDTDRHMILRDAFYLHADLVTMIDSLPRIGVGHESYALLVAVRALYARYLLQATTPMACFLDRA
jgi:hypothetical protein